MARIKWQNVNPDDGLLPPPPPGAVVDGVAMPYRPPLQTTPNAPLAPGAEPPPPPRETWRTDAEQAAAVQRVYAAEVAQNIAAMLANKPEEKPPYAPPKNNPDRGNNRGNNMNDGNKNDWVDRLLNAATTLGGNYLNGGRNNLASNPPVTPPPPRNQPVDWKKWGMIGGGILALVLVLGVVLKRK